MRVQPINNQYINYQNYQKKTNVINFTHNPETVAKTLTLTSILAYFGIHKSNKQEDKTQEFFTSKTIQDAIHIMMRQPDPEEKGIVPNEFNKSLADKAKLLTEFSTGIANAVDSPYSAQIAEKFLSDKNLQNKDLMPKAQGFIDSVKNEHSAGIAQKILSDEELYGDGYFMASYANDLLGAVDTSERANVADKILSDEASFFKDIDFMDKGAFGIINAVNSPETAQVAISYLSVISENFDDLYSNFLTQKAKDFVSAVKNEHSAGIAQKILSKEALYKDSDFMQNYANDILKAVDTPEKAKVAACYLSLIANDICNQSLMSEAKDIISAVKNEYSAGIADPKILYNSELYKDDYFMQNHAIAILKAVTTEASAQIAEIFLSDDKLYGDNELMSKAGDIIRAAKTLESVPIANKIISYYRDGVSGERLLKNAKDIISAVTDSQSAEIADALLSNKNIRESSFLDYADSIIDDLKDLDPSYKQLFLDLINKISKGDSSDSLDKVCDLLTTMSNAMED